MSIDPFTGRNPSYCTGRGSIKPRKRLNSCSWQSSQDEGFVELEPREQADRAIQELNGKDLLGRPVRRGPGVAQEKLVLLRQQMACDRGMSRSGWVFAKLPALPRLMRGRSGRQGSFCHEKYQSQ